VGNQSNVLLPREKEGGEIVSKPQIQTLGRGAGIHDPPPEKGKCTPKGNPGGALKEKGKRVMYYQMGSPEGRNVLR